MSAYRPLGPFPQFLLADGTVNNGGLIHFYQTDLTTLQDTWSDIGLTTLNANPVVLDSSGQPTTDIWGSAAYGVVITDSLGANPRTFNNIQPDVGSGATIPSLVNGDFLTNNGSVLLWQPIAQLPDPTGHAGQILFTDGTLDYWGAVPTPDIAITANSFQGGISTNTSKFLVQMGTDTAPASGVYQTTRIITFPIPFTTCLHASAQPLTNSQAGGPVVSYPSSAATAVGVTFSFDVAEASGSSPNILNPVPFTWVAMGFVTV
jgi:hypothetical protein